MVDEGSSPRPVSSLLEGWENGKIEKGKETIETIEKDKDKDKDKEVEVEKKNDVAILEASEENKMKEGMLLEEPSASSVKSACDMKEYVQ